MAGFRAWQQRGRQVRKGEKAIRIYGYSSRIVTETDPDTGDEETRKVPTFPILSVFDHSQTDPIEGHPQPEEIAQLLTGADPDAIYDRVAAIMTGRGWTVTREAIASSANGYTTTDGSHRIVVDAALEPAAAAKTMIHELLTAPTHTSSWVSSHGCGCAAPCPVAVGDIASRLCSGRSKHRNYGGEQHRNGRPNERVPAVPVAGCDDFDRRPGWKHRLCRGCALRRSPGCSR